MYQYYTVQEFADIYAVHTNTVYNWINDGTIEAHRLGGRIIRIPESECDVLAMPIRVKPHPRNRHKSPKTGIPHTPNPENGKRASLRKRTHPPKSERPRQPPEPFNTVPTTDERERSDMDIVNGHTEHKESCTPVQAMHVYQHVNSEILESSAPSAPESPFLKGCSSANRSPSDASIHEAQSTMTNNPGKTEVS